MNSDGAYNVNIEDLENIDDRIDDLVSLVASLEQRVDRLEKAHTNTQKSIGTIVKVVQDLADLAAKWFVSC